MSLQPDLEKAVREAIIEEAEEEEGGRRRIVGPSPKRAKTGRRLVGRSPERAKSTLAGGGWGATLEYWPRLRNDPRVIEIVVPESHSGSAVLIGGWGAWRVFVDRWWGDREHRCYTRDRSPQAEPVRGNYAEAGQSGSFASLASCDDVHGWSVGRLVIPLVGRA
jgi:hypothetical protein